MTTVVTDTMANMTRRVRWVPVYVLAHVTPVLASTAVWIIVCAVQPLVIVIGLTAGVLAFLARNSALAPYRAGASGVRAVVAGYCLPWLLAAAAGAWLLDAMS